MFQEQAAALGLISDKTTHRYRGGNEFDQNRFEGEKVFLNRPNIYPMKTSD